MLFHALVVGFSGYIHQGESLWKNICGNQKKKKKRGILKIYRFLVSKLDGGGSSK